MQEAKLQLSRLAALAREGRSEDRQLGGFEGQIQMSEDFDEEDAELVAAIERSTIFPDKD